MGAVFASPALLAACFGAADGSYDPAALEATYVTLMRTYEAAPPVVAALRASIPRLLSHLGGEIEAAQVAQTVALLALLRNRAPAMSRTRARHVRDMLHRRCSRTRSSPTRARRRTR